MSTNPIKKLNLKALVPVSEREEQEEISQASSEMLNTGSSKQETTTLEALAHHDDTPATSENSPLSHKISLSDIKKSPELEKEKKISKTENQNSTDDSQGDSTSKTSDAVKIQKNEAISYTPPSTKTMEEGEKKEEKKQSKDTINTQDISQETPKKLQQETKKKQGFFSRFRTSKKENTQQTQEDDEIHFDNYTSDFEKKSKNILKRVQNFRYTPKTRKGFIIGIIAMTFGFIGLLMIVFPEKHSVTIYKASILEIIHQKERIIRKQPTLTTQETENTQKAIQKKEIHTPPQSTEAPTNPHKKEEKKEKLRNFLLEKYKKEE